MRSLLHKSVRRYLKIGLLGLLCLLLRLQFCVAADNGSEVEVLIEPVTIAGLYDVKGFPWAEELFEFTVKLINNHSDGWFDNVLNDTPLKYSISDAACDQDMAVLAYLNLTRGVNPSPNAILGCRCSGPSMDISRLASAENLAVVSPSATSAELSNKALYPTFSRLVAPDDNSGQVGALVMLLRSFGWDRISIINTDTQYTKNFQLELAHAWAGKHSGDDPFTGEIRYKGTVKVNKETEKINPTSVEQVLTNVPTDKPTINSKVIVLLAHHQHAYEILKIAKQMHFQPDTIWIGVAAWTGRAPVDLDTSWMPPIPGYIGVVPYRDLTTPVYTDFLGRLQDEQRRQNRPVTTDLPDSAADRIVDSIIALSMALSSVAPDQRHNGEVVVAALRKLRFVGVSGLVDFNEQGDWANPRYTVMTLPINGAAWISIGSVSLRQVDVDYSKICYAEVGCGQGMQTGTYPVPTDSLPMWVTAVVVLLAVVAVILCIVGLLFAHQYYYGHKPLRDKLRKLEDEISGLDTNKGAVEEKKGKLYKEIAKLLGQERPSHWGDAEGLVDIPPTDKTYWVFLDQLNATMNPGETCHITSLSRVQNDGIWAYTVFRKNQLANKYDIEDLSNIRTLSVWHGTSALNPVVIYNDTQEGFMQQYSQEGLYGRGIYFAERSGYSDCYSYRVDAGKGLSLEERESLQPDREMFLVNLVVGEARILNHNESTDLCKSLRTPPDNPFRASVKFDTVTGEVGDGEYRTKIHVVYENGRAYPEYLVRYYKGARDPTRTRYASYEEATADKMGVDTSMTMHTTTATMTSAEFSSTGSSSAIGKSIAYSSEDNEEPGKSPADSSDDIETGESIAFFSGDAAYTGESTAFLRGDSAAQTGQSTAFSAEAIWMYEDDSYEWSPYHEAVQSVIEAAYRAKTARTTIVISPWNYELDFEQGTQTNLDHPGRRHRRIRRTQID